MDDISTDGRIIVLDSSVIIDLNGYKISREASTATQGGGVFGVMSGASLEVTDGKVTGGYRRADGSGNGGAFNVNGTLILRDVEVYGNRAVSAGGGIYIAGDSASATLSGKCSVHDNTAGTNGGGIYVDHGGSLQIEGAPVVKDNGSSNVYLPSGYQIKVAGALSEDADVGVTFVDEGKRPFTDGYGSYNSNLMPDKVFFEDGKKAIAWSPDEGEAGEARTAYRCISRSWDPVAGKVDETTLLVSDFTAFDEIKVSGDDTVDLKDDNWYVVRESVDIDRQIRCFIRPNILLCDGAKLTCLQGITVEDNNTVNIYGQTSDSGQLIATGNQDSAGIGSQKNKTAGHINIYGGTVEATGGLYGSGIGSGDKGPNGDVNIYGGKITAKGGNLAPGIGSGCDNTTFGCIRIYGGVVNATGGESGAGIGGGGRYVIVGYGKTTDGTIEIGGGTVNANGGSNGAGIGSGAEHDMMEDVEIIISGGKVNATGGEGGRDTGCAGIGGGRHFKGKITITGGDVYALGGGVKETADIFYRGAAGIGGGTTGNMTGTITISGGKVQALGYGGGASIGSGIAGSCVVDGEQGLIKITGGMVKLGFHATKDHDHNYRHLGLGRYPSHPDQCDISIADDLCVYYEGSDPVLSNNRVSTCTEEVVYTPVSLCISACEHKNTEYTYDEEQHTNHCLNCSIAYTPKDHVYENGVCTVCGHILDDGMGVRFAGYSLSLDGDIAVDYYIELSDAVMQSGAAYIHFDLPGGGSKELYLTMGDTKVVGGKTYHVYKCKIAAKDINSEIKAYIVNGSDKGTVYSFTVKDYADYLLAHTGDDQDYAKAEDLVRALLDYGAYAEDYFGVESDLEPSEGALDGVDIDDGFAYNVDNTYLPDGVTLAGASLSLKSETTLSLYIESEQPLSNISCKYKDMYDYRYERVDTDKYTIIRIRGISVQDLDRVRTVKFKVGNDATIYHIGYCPLTYCFNIVKGDYGKKITNVCKALYRYWCTAEEYYPQ